MGERIREHDWRSHPLGSPERWPRSLQVALRVLLNTGHPMYVFWGPQHYCFYNDAYRLSIGPERHPGSLGRPGREVWDEIWDIIGPQIEQVMSGGPATWHENALVPITRNGRREDVYWTYSYGPIDDEHAESGVGGVLVVCTETTAAVTSERALAEQSERHRRVLEQAPGLILVTSGPDHVVEFVNQAHRALFDSAGLIGRSLREVDLPFEDVDFIAHLDAVYRTGETKTLDDVRVRLAGAGAARTRHLKTTCTPYVDAAGAVTGIFCEGFDLTTARRAEDALREIEGRSKLALEAAGIGAWDYDPVQDVLRWDARCKELFGLPADAEVSYEGAFLAGLHPDDRQRVDEQVQDALSPHGSGRYDTEYRTIGLRDGVERWISATGRAIYEDGAAVRFVGTVLDISARKRAEHRLDIVNRTGAAVAAEHDIDTILQSITDAGVALTGAQFGAFFYNAVDETGDVYMLYALSGAPRSAFDHFPMPRNTSIFAPTFAGEGPVRSDDITTDPRYGRNAPFRGMPEGHLPVRSYLAVPVVMSSGEVYGGLFFGHEDAGVFEPEHEGVMLGIAGHAATAVHNSRLINDLQRLNGELEMRVTAEVSERMKAEERLRQAQKLEAIGQLTGGVAHDFNNLLMVVNAGLNLIETSDDPERRPLLVARMRDAVTRGATLTKQLLAFSRKQELNPQGVDFRDLLSGMSDLLDRSLSASVHVEADVPADLTAVHVDETALQLAILNLAVNARDAMPDGGTIIIRARNGSASNPGADVVSISVIDTGVGMSRETQQRIFEPFFTTKEIGKGSGLGLAQVHGFAQQSGGEVVVESEEGKGTTVTLILPRGELAPAAAPAMDDALDRAAPRPGRVLLVEDDDDVAAMTADMLSHLGWRPVRVGSAEEALAVLETDAGFDLMFSDVMMPGGMNGVELARTVRAARPDLPVLLASAYSAAVEREARRAEAPLLSKPFDLTRLQAALGQVLG